MTGVAFDTFMEPASEDVLGDMIDRHLEEAVFFWGRWEQSLNAPDYSLQDVIDRVEERLLAHLQGLVHGGAHVAERWLLPLLDGEGEDSERERLSVAARALLEGPGAKYAGSVLEHFTRAEAKLRSVLQRALELSEHPTLPSLLQPLLEHREPAVQAAALEVLAFRGVDVRDWPERLLASQAPQAVTGALRALRWQPTSLLRRHALRHALTQEETRDMALEAALIHDIPEAWSLCRELVASRQPVNRTALVLVAMGGGTSELNLLLDRLAAPERQGDILWALGFSGRIEAAEVCLEFMEHAAHARLAGEAFSAITGLPLHEEFVRESVVPTQEEPLPLEQEDLDADLRPSPQDALPIPDPAAVSGWWQGARSGFTSGVRYAYGRPLEPDSLLDALRDAPMRRRHTHALELAIRSGGALQINTLASTRVQVRQMAQARARRSLIRKAFVSSYPIHPEGR